MILTCPQCSTRYQADAAKFAGTGRKVRCAKCGHVWHQTAAEPDADDEGAAALDTAPPPAKPAPAHTPIPPRRTAAPVQEQASVAAADNDDGPPAAAPQRPAWKDFAWKGNALALAGWAGLIAAILIVGWSAVRYRQEVATLWPRSASLYASVGLPVNARGLAFSDVTYSRDQEDGEPVLAVTGSLVNISGRELAVPPVTLVMTDDSKRELYRWTFTPTVSTLAAGQSVKFSTRVSSPPTGAEHLQLQFAEAEK
jgi:predicted Zn finger-like uncharacterized protein